MRTWRALTAASRSICSSPRSQGATRVASPLDIWPMSYVTLAGIFFFSVALAMAFIGLHLLRKLSPRARTFWRAHRRGLLRFYGLWFGSYALFIALGTGPSDLASYPPTRSSPYKLPWRAGARRFVAQGNRSFTSHRGSHLHAWDFCMAVGTEVLAAREGQVVEVEDRWDGIGVKANFVAVEHADGTRAVYAHVRRGGVVVTVGEHVRQGQLVAYSGMVGQTLFPHLHFVVQSRDGSASVPVSFADVADGVPLAGRFSTSQNDDPRPR
jgi:murein DD-endopeptidase MepM/ murein hydrolase activator NlpD